MENDIKVNIVFLYSGILTKFWSLGIAKILVRLAMLLFSVKKFGAFSL